MYQDNWFIVSPDSYKFEFVEGETAEEQGHIVMEKASGADGFFDDALTYLFLSSEDGETELADQRPQHIHFEVQTGSESMETCDFRFYSVEKVEAEAKRRRLDGEAEKLGEEDIDKQEDDDEPSNDD